MTSKWGWIFFIVIVATSLYSSTGQRTHIVGDFGDFAWYWSIPRDDGISYGDPETFVPGDIHGAIVYTNWASQETFVQGDILVFSFTNGYHNVAEVSRTSYDTCKITESPISIVTNGPASITLNSAGENYYICTFPGHCDAGMKLAINVTAATAPPPESIPPSPAPVPSPSRTPLSDVTPSDGIAPTDGFVHVPQSASSASKFVVTSAMPITFLSIAFAFAFF